MKIVFFGTPEYVVPILEGLHKEYNRGHERELIAVVTQSPKPVGRDQKVTYSAVDTFAHHHKIDILFDANELGNADLGICAAYGKIIPESVLKKFSMGILNVHPSLLPTFRGAAPIQSTLVTGLETSGVTIIKMDSELDHGPIVSAFKSEVRPIDTNESLRDRLFIESVDFLLQLIPSYISGKISLKEQIENDAIYTKPIVKEDGYIPGMYLSLALEGNVASDEWHIRFIKDFSTLPDAHFIERYIRAVTPWPGAYTTVKVQNQEKRLKLLKAHVEENVLVLDEVQLEGKNPVSWKQFTDGYKTFSFA